MRAANPDEVNFLILTERGQKTVGYYSHHGDAKMLYCIIDIFDLIENRSIVKDTVWGSKPKSVITPGDETHGSYPDRKVVKYLKRFF
jgi:hypothetical protein